MESLVALVGGLIATLRSFVAPDVCPGAWAWATSALGIGIGLLPTAGALGVAVARRTYGSRYGLAGGPLVAGFGLLSAGLFPLLLFLAAGRVFAIAADGGTVPGLSAAEARSLRGDVCFVGSQSSYLGSGSVADSFNPQDPVQFVIALLLLGFVPLCTAGLVAAQARLALRRGPAWPAKFFWMPTLALAVFTAAVPTGTAEHLWVGAFAGAFAGMMVMVLVPPPSKEVVRRSLEQPARRPLAAAPPPRALPQAGGARALPVAPPPAAPPPRAAPPRPTSRQPSPPLAADPGSLPLMPGRTPTGPHGLPVVGSGPPSGNGRAPVGPAPVGPASRGNRAPRFRLIRPIGSGGFARVWVAQDAKLGHVVALKSAHARDAETEERIRREAAALAAVRHPLCVRVYDLVHAGSDPGLGQLDGLVLVMQYVEGVSLGTLVQERGPVDDVAAARIWSGAAGALEAAHQRGVLHRDLKPGNIIIDPGGHPYLIDFGIARRTGDSTLTQTGFVLGTPDYLAPEVAAGGKATPASDIWQLAATVSFSLTGYPPRGGHADAISGLRAAASGAKLSHLPRRTAHLSLLKQSLRNEPGRRPALRTTGQALDEWLRKTGVVVDGPVSAGAPRR